MKNEKVYAVIKTNRYDSKITSLHHRFEDAHLSAIRLFLENVETSTSNKKDIYQNIQSFMTLDQQNPKEPVIRSSLDNFNESHIEINFLLNTTHIYSNWDNHTLMVSVKELPKTIEQ